jgi:hypothetical protein
LKLARINSYLKLLCTRSEFATAKEIELYEYFEPVGSEIA